MNDWPQGYDGHRREQRRRIAREATPEQRVQWLEEMLFFLWENDLLPSKLPPQDEIGGGSTGFKPVPPTA